jgi:hypothetical protein
MSKPSDQMKWPDPPAGIQLSRALIAEVNPYVSEHHRYRVCRDIIALVAQWEKAREGLIRDLQSQLVDAANLITPPPRIVTRITK